MRTMDNLYNMDAEQSVIGGVLLWHDSDKSVEAMEILKPTDFYSRDHKFFWEGICELSRTGKHIDLITLSSYLKDHGVNCEFSYLGEISRAVPSNSSVSGYARIVKNLSKLRSALSHALSACEALQDKGEPEDRLNNALSHLAKIADDDSEQEIKDPVDVLTNVLNQMGAAHARGDGLVGISSGFENIDRLTFGFQRQDLIVVAAPPSMGKTTLSLNFAEYAAFLDPTPRNVLVFSLEMSAEQMMKKTMANLGNLYLKKIISGSALDDIADNARIANAQTIIMSRRKHYRIDDKGGQHITQIQARAKRTAIKMGGLDLIVVDYLHKVEGDGESEMQRIGSVTKGLKNLAKELGCPIIALSQLNRAFSGRPEMKNLLGSSKIEQDADMVIFLYDEDYQGVRNDRSLTEVIFAKNRMGETGSTFLQPELGMSRFADTQRLPEPKQEESKKTYRKRYDE